MAKSYKRVPNAQRKRITLERLKALVSYSPETGLFTRVSSPRPQNAYLVGSVAGTIKKGTQASGGGYRILSIDGRTYRAHQLAWLWMTGSWPTHDVDHINGDRDDNRWTNLRAATRSQNIANSRGCRDSLTGIKGVTYDKSRGKWQAQIGVGWREDKQCYWTKSLGRFDTPEEAAEAYRRAAQERFGEFARTV